MSSTNSRVWLDQNVLRNLLNQARILAGTTDSNGGRVSSSIDELLLKRLNSLKNSLSHPTSLNAFEGDSSQEATCSINAVPEVSEKESEIQYEALDSLELRWHYVIKSVNVLESMEEVLRKMSTADDRDERDLLGIKDLRIVHTLLEIVVIFGLYPCFLQGVNIPLAKRSHSGFVQKEAIPSYSASNSNLSLSSPHNKSVSTPKYSAIRLYFLTMHLSSLLIHSPLRGDLRLHTYTTISSILLSRHLTDVLAGLLQLGYGPLKIMEDILPSSASEETVLFSMDMLERGENSNSQRKMLTATERKKCIQMCNDLLQRLPPQQSLVSLNLLLSNSTSNRPPTPKWLVNICGHYLSQLLLRPDGVKIVMEYMLGNSAGQQEVSLTQIDKIARVILTVPSQVPSVEGYYGQIVPQLLTILIRPQPPGPPTSLIQTVTQILTRITLSHPHLSKKLIIAPICGGLWQWWGYSPAKEDSVAIALNTNTDVNDETLEWDEILLSESSLNRTLETLQVLLQNAEPTAELLNIFLADSVVVLYNLYAFATQSRSYMREISQDLLVMWFRIVNGNEATQRLRACVLETEKCREDGSEVYFGMGSNGGVEMRLRRIPLPKSTTKFDEILVNLLQQINSDELSGDFFVMLLNEYTTLQNNNAQPRLILTILSLILQMVDKMGPSVIKKPSHIIHFVSNILEGYLRDLEKRDISRDKVPLTQNTTGLSGFLNIIQNSEADNNYDDEEDEAEGFEKSEQVSLALSLLMAVLEDESLNPQTSSLLSLVSENLLNLTKKPAVPPDIINLSRPILLILTARSAASTTTKFSSQDTSLEKYRSALSALEDPLLPVRAHGLGQLKELVLSHDPITAQTDTRNKILDIFVQTIQDDDSFIYLNAVKGLAAMSDVYGREAIEKLGQVYIDKNKILDHRLRIGEALLLTVQRSGEALGKYVDVILGPLLKVLRDPNDKHLRMSALSIIGAACETNPLSLSSRFREIIDWVLTILDLEKEVEVRRAATVLIVSLIRGLASQTLYEYPADLLKRSYRSLRYIEQTDLDELTRVQARIGLGDLNSIIKQEFTIGEQRFNHSLSL